MISHLATELCYLIIVYVQYYNFIILKYCNVGTQIKGVKSVLISFTDFVHYYVFINHYYVFHDLPEMLYIIFT